MLQDQLQKRTSLHLLQLLTYFHVKYTCKKVRTAMLPYLVIFTLYKRHIHIVGRWTYIFILFSIKNIYAHKMYFGMAMFTSLRS